MAPASPPYGLDFLFTMVTNVHFAGGDWVVVTIDGARTSLALSGSVNFPGISGGTPGLSIDSGPWSQYPHVVTAADLKQQVRLGAGGTTLTAFGVQGINADPHSPLGNQLAFSDVNLSIYGYDKATHIFFQMPSASKFAVSVNANVSPAQQLSIACWPVAKATVIAGLQPPLPLPALYPSPLQVSKNSAASVTSLSAQFTIDPVKLTVVAS